MRDISRKIKKESVTTKDPKYREGTEHSCEVERKKIDREYQDKKDKHLSCEKRSWRHRSNEERFG